MKVPVAAASGHGPHRPGSGKLLPPYYRGFPGVMGTRNHRITQLHISPLLWPSDAKTPPGECPGGVACQLCIILNLLTFDNGKAWFGACDRLVAPSLEKAGHGDDYLCHWAFRPSFTPCRYQQPSSASTATGWSDSCRAGFAPAEEWRLSTAHAKSCAKDRRVFPDGGNAGHHWQSVRRR